MGVKPKHIPEHNTDLIPAEGDEFVTQSGESISLSEVQRNIASFLSSAAQIAQATTGDEHPEFNEVEALIAYRRNAEGLKPQQSLGALETDLVKVSVLGFQVGTDRDREVMAKLDKICGSLTETLIRPRDLRQDTAVFELGLRRLPEGLPFLVVAGVREAIRYVYEELDFNEEAIQFLKKEIPATRGWDLRALELPAQLQRGDQESHHHRSPRRFHLHRGAQRRRSFAQSGRSSHRL